ncbi:thioesterase family protein [Lentisphaerota bacterium ZTH]|nr:thioesterase family protein [Lentisphaerota bacterium]WET07505.1 thioesterase family protein [Lentisphaerota bacterium ZTH]
MPKLKLKPLDNYTFSIDIPVRINDINYGNHLGNHNLVSILHEARFRFIQSLGFEDERDAGIIMQDLAVNYKLESFCNDILTVHVGVGEVSKVTLRMFYMIENQDNKLVALAETGLAFLDYETRKIVIVPEKLRSCC